MGGILLRPDGTPLRYWAAPIDGAVADFLGVTVGESDFMTTFELLAFLTSLVVWESALQRHAVGIRPEMDNISALHITATSPHGTLPPITLRRKSPYGCTPPTPPSST